MKHSEIFNSFVKIAQEKGLISNDSNAAKKKLEETGRADSLDISAIEALYGVKPNTPKSNDYKKNIMEAAHPNSVVVCPSYDKLNGLVENNIERQNILLHIVSKNPNGYSTQHKYAQQDLVLSLVRLGNELDNRNQDELRSLADFCLLQASNKQLKKQGAAPLIIGVVVGIAALFGGLYAKQHMRFISDGFTADHQKLVAEIDDILESNSNFGVGYDYKPEFLQIVRDLKVQVQAYAGVEKQIEGILEKLQMPRTVDQLKEMAKEPETQEITNSIKAFNTATQKIWSFLESFVKDLDDESYKQRQVTDKGILSKLVDQTQILHGGGGLIADDLDDVKHALQTYMLDIQNISKVLSGTTSFAQNAQQKLTAAISNAPVTTQNTPESGTSSRAKDEEQLGIGGLSQSLQDYTGGLLGKKQT
jgi:hypothetical protein